MDTGTAILLGIFAPPVTACVVALIGRRSAFLRDAAGPLGAVITFIAAIRIAGAVRAGETPALTLATITEGFDITFRIHPAGAVFGLVASGLWVLAALYSIGYMRGNKEAFQTRFATCYAIAIHAAMGIAWSGNLMVLFVFYEILTFSTYPLVAHKGNREALRAGRLYLGILVGTSLIFLLPAILWVWVATGRIDFAPGGILQGALDPQYAPFLLALFAFGIGKVALMPLHRWLPAAMVAPTPVSALLHAVAVVKAGAFTILVVMVHIFGIDYLAETGASLWLVWLASFTILAASVIAMRCDDLKARLAYSTVSQLSYIVLAGALATRLAAEAGLVHIAMHAAGKITLFFCAGAIYTAAHLRLVSELDGVGRKMPLVFIAFSLGALSIIGIPPLGGTWSKLMLMGGALEAGLPLILAVLAVSSLLNVYYLLEVPFRAFFAKPKPGRRGAMRAPLLTVLPPVMTALLSIALFFGIDMLTAFSRMMVSP